MNSKILNHIKKITVAFMIVILCSTSMAGTVSAASWSLFNKDNSSIFNSNNNNENSFINSFIDKIFSVFNKQETETETSTEDYKELLSIFNNMLTTGDFSIDGITEAIKTIIPEGNDQDVLLFTVESFTGDAASMLGLDGLDLGNFDLNLDLNLDISGLLKTLINLLSSLIGSVAGLLVDEIDADITDTMTITATTAGEFVEGYQVELSAKVYMHDNDEGNWAVVVHPFMLNGEIMAGAVGQMYYDAGYNVLAPDLRGFGDSEGSVALGFLESLDVYDWLVKLNDVYKPTNVIVHGVSLGAATTNFLSGIDEFVPIAGIKSLTDLNVIGLVEDCGYINMEDFADASLILSLGVGLTEDNFATYGNATASLKACDVPMLVIHGTSDSMVDIQNAYDIIEIRENAGGYVESLIIDGGAHASIIMGGNDEYTEKVTKFIKTCEDMKPTTSKANDAAEKADADGTDASDDATDDTPWYEKIFNGSFFNKYTSGLTKALKSITK